ncbi:hypothetical protein FRB91_010988 [Serendipita sp. 411]|nr:hypothetical protein FRB91_010988 [Serendipita sp. 411]
MMLFITVNAFAIAVLSVVAASPVVVDDVRGVESVPAGFNITSMGFKGNGCPPGTAYYALNFTATHQATYHFQGQLRQATSRVTLIGPISAKEYIYRDKFDFGAVTVSPCGTNTVLAINSAVRVSGNKPNSGYLCTDVWDPPSPLKQTFAFSWSKC